MSLFPVPNDIFKLRLTLKGNFEDTVGLLWDFGFAVDSAKVAYFILILDKYLRYNLVDTFPKMQDLLSRSKNMPDLARKIVDDLELQPMCMEFARSQLDSIDPKSHQLKDLQQLLKDIYDFQSLFVLGTMIQNQKPLGSLPDYLRLKLRIINPLHTYRWVHGKRADSTGTYLATVSQWVPDLEAIVTLNYFIKVNQIPLFSPAEALQEIVPIGARKSVPVKSLSEWMHAMVIPAKKLRRPAIQNESLLLCIKTIFAIDYERLNEDQILRLTRLLDELQSKELKRHLFIEPLYRGAPEIAIPVELPAEVTEMQSFRYKAGGRADRPKDLNERLSEIFAGVKAGIQKISPEEVQKFYQEAKQQSQKRLQQLTQKLQNRDFSEPEEQRPVPTVYKRQPRPSVLTEKMPDIPILKQLDAALIPYESRPPDVTNLMALLSSSFWRTHPYGISNLCSRILTALLPEGSAIPTDLDSRFLQASVANRFADIKIILSDCIELIQLASAEKIAAITKVAASLSDVHDVLYQDFCSKEATRLIHTQNWDALTVGEKVKLSKLINQKHILHVAHRELEQFFQKDSLSHKEIENLGMISVKIIEKLILLLERDDNPSSQHLLQKIRQVHQRHADNLRNRMGDTGRDFVAECQDWIHSICIYLYEQDNKHFYESVREIESMFVSVWKKVEEQLSEQIAR